MILNLSQRALIDGYLTFHRENFNMIDGLGNLFFEF